MTVVVTPALSLAELDTQHAEALRTSFRSAGEHLLADLRRVVEAAGVPVRTLYAEGVPADEILAEAGRGYLLIAMGSRGVGLTGHDRSLLGSVSDRVIRQCPIPVLVVPGASQ
jgi:nucleotide-binding universal stress UspA family protein